MTPDVQAAAGRVRAFLDERGPERDNVISTAGPRAARYAKPRLRADDLRTLLAALDPAEQDAELEHLRDENADLRQRLESIRLVASCLPYIVQANPSPNAAHVAVGSIARAIDGHAALDPAEAPIGHVPTPQGRELVDLYRAHRTRQHPRGEEGT